MPAAAVFAIGSAVLGLAIALLVQRIAREPGWKDHRAFALVALTAGLDSLANLHSTLPMAAPAAVLLARLQLLLLGLHLAAWHRFASGALADLRGPAERLAVHGAAALGLVSLVPGLVYRPWMGEHDVPWLGWRYFDPVPTAFGNLVLALFVASGLALVLRFARAWRRGVPRTGLPLAGLLLTLAMASHDALVTAGAFSMPLLLDFGFVAPIAAVAYAMVARFAADARALASLRQHLEEEVAARTGDLERTRSALHQAQKLGALGQFAAGVAHEVNNPAAVVSANLGWLAETGVSRRCDDPEVRECLGESVAAMERIAHVVRQLLDASRVAAHSAKVPLRAVPLARVAAEAARVARARLGDRVTLVTAVPLQLHALGEEHLLVQVVGNLVVNAVQAVPAGRGDGRVTVSAERVPPGVRLVVEDNGAGMSPEVMQRLFEPFFSTKPRGSGTGLGLAVSRGFVMSMGGSLRFESQPGRGTRAILELEEGEEGVPGTAPAAAAPAPLAEVGGLHLLLVDDEPHALSSLRRLLEARFQVSVAGGVEEALARCAEQRFDLVLADVLMPAGGGERLLLELRRRWPEAAERLVFLTGGVASEEVRRFLAGQAQPVLHKPLDVAALAEVARRLRGPSYSGATGA